MIDVIAGLAVVVGSALALLAGFGLLRFPDALTRLHASSKAATIGVIATTFAAALEAGPGGAALLVLVIGLLFLTAPIGASLLAAAAVGDPDTPLVPMQHADLGSVTWQTAGSARDAGAAPQAMLVAWLVVVWVSLFASVTAGVVLGALGVGALLTIAFPGLRFRRFRGTLRPLAVLRLAVHFVRSLVAANVDVAAAVLRRRPPRPAVVTMALRVESPAETALLMNMITFTPGTVALELHEHRLTIHVLDFVDSQSFVAELTALEERIVDAFGSGRERAKVRSVATDARPR
jgi:monovalent cation/proton antiporter MnhG/PhaG subunit